MIDLRSQNLSVARSSSDLLTKGPHYDHRGFGTKVKHEELLSTQERKDVSIFV